MRWFAALGERLRGLLMRAGEDVQMDQEMSFHIEMEAERLMREEGLDRDEAERRARVAFGGVEKYKEEVREARGLAWVSGLSLDLKLGLRMLVKHPGLALIGGLGITVAIAIGAVAFEISSGLTDARLPFAGGDRVVAIEYWDTEINNQERRILHDFETWQQELETVEELGAWRSLTRTLITSDGRAEPVELAEMTASGFRLTGVVPVSGRPLMADDERESASPVVVIGNDLWRTRFGSDPAIVGKQVHLGRTIHTVIGVMPEGFAFPVNQNMWVPFRADASDYERRSGPGIFVFGRLAPGATLAQARAEMEAHAAGAAEAFPETHTRLRPHVVPYTLQFLDDMQGWEFRILNLFVVLLLAVICVNVAILVYARTASRQGEIAVRTALGASRRRVMTQLLVEAFVLSAGAAAVGLAVVWLVLRQVKEAVDRITFIPFWLDFELSLSTVAYAGALAVLAAAIVGVVPAVKATGRGVQSSLRALGGATGLRMGRTWTALIIIQVAAAVAVLPAAGFFAWELTRYGFTDPGFAADEYLSTWITMERESAPSGDPEAREQEFRAQYEDRIRELERRLGSEPDVAAVTLTSHTVGDEMKVRVEVEGGATRPESETGQQVRAARVDPQFFHTFDLPLLTGRTFDSADPDPEVRDIVVNRAFVEQALGGGAALGRRIRYAQGERAGGAMRLPAGVDQETWYEVVGVVGNLMAGAMHLDDTAARIYHPRIPGAAYPVTLSLRAHGSVPASMPPRLRSIMASVDPALQPRDLRPLETALRDEQGGMRLMALGILLVTLSVLLLSAAGVHALMSFTVARRRKEIGIRSALGANRRRLLGGIFFRAGRQLAAGVAAGVAAAAILNLGTGGELTGGRGIVFVPAVAAIMLVVGLVATAGPARRALRLQPTEALKEE